MDRPNEETQPPARRRGRLGSLWRVAWIAGLLFVLVIEVGTRLVEIEAFSDAQLLDPFRPQTSVGRNGPHPYLAYAPLPSWTTPPDQGKQASHNELGFRGPLPAIPKPDGIKRVVCLGGSSTYGTGPSSDAATWPAQLEQELNAQLEARGESTRVEVINGGAPGWTTFESLGNLAFRMLDLEPDLVVVYHATNDAGMTVYEFPVRGDNTHARKAWETRGLSPVEKALERSRLFLIWRRYGMGIETDQRSLGAYTLVDPDVQWRPPLDKLDDPRGFQNFARNLRSIAALARAHGAEPVFVTQAHLPPDDNDMWVHGRARVAALRRNLDILAELAQELEIPLVDMAARFEREVEAQLANEGRQRLLSGTVHLRDPGARLLGRGLANELLRLELLP
jgi:lysophospholipase L1-like esterase